jgi:hypothetical protein
MNKKVFKTKDENGQEIELAVLRPSPKVQVQSQLEYNKAWAKAEKGGSILRRNLDELAERHGLWDNDKRTKVEALGTEVIDLERKLRSGANSFASLEDAKAAALKIKKLRAERAELLYERNSLDPYTAEAFADSVRLQYMVSQSTVYSTGNKAGTPYFVSYEDYVARSNEKIAEDAFSNYLELIYDDVPESPTDEAYEIKWLKKYKFVDEKGRNIDSKGRLVSEDGKLINADFKYITEDEKTCDRDGFLVDDKGEYLIEYKEWDSEPIAEVVDQPYEDSGPVS